MLQTQKGAHGSNNRTKYLPNIAYSNEIQGALCWTAGTNVPRWIPFPVADVCIVTKIQLNNQTSDKKGVEVQLIEHENVARTPTKHKKKVEYCHKMHAKIQLADHVNAAKAAAKHNKKTEKCREIVVKL